MIAGVGAVEVTLLGGFGVAVDGAPVPAGAWRLKKARELVKLLALANGFRLHRDQVLDALWRELPPGSALNNLHQAVYVARRVLGPDAILSEDELLRLAAEVDVERFERASREALRICTPAAYRSALSLYGGELLPENRYDDWAETRRTELAERAAELEEALRTLDGDGSEVSLPVETSSFVGRSRELGELRMLLRRTRLLSLCGPGGAGKTRLALELARTVEDPPANGAVLVELASVSDPSAVADAVAYAVDVRAMPGQAVVEALTEFVSSRSLLLVVDNCEHVLRDAAALVATLLAAAPRLMIVATSREPLRVAGEVVFRVPPLTAPDPERAPDPRRLARYEAVQLFVERAAEALPGFELDDDNASDVARICSLLDGLPLALELAAGRVAALGPYELSGRLDDRFRLLRSGSTAAPTRQQTLSATLQWSHELLEPDERALLRRLAVFAEGFELGAVEDVCSDEDLDVPGVADVLARLVDKSLVHIDERTARERRYRLLETVRLYALERLDEAGETAALRERHARWAGRLAAGNRHSPRLDREVANLRAALETLQARAPEQALRLCIDLTPLWLRRIDLDEARRRFDDALSAAHGHTLLLAEGLLAAAAIDLRRGAVAEGVARAEASHGIAAEADAPLVEWRALQLRAEFGIATDDAAVAATLLEAALDLARREELAAPFAISTYTLGVVHWIRRELDRAESLLGESVERFRLLSGSDAPIPSLVNVEDFDASVICGWSGRRIVFEDTLQPFTEITCEAAVGYVLANQGVIVRSRGDRERARSLLSESADLFDALEDAEGRAASLVRLAYLELAEGAVVTAREALEKALRIRRGRNDRRGVGLALSGLGLVAMAAGDGDGAERHLMEARELFRRAGDRWGLATTLWRSAELALSRDELQPAESALEEARAVLQPTKRERWVANTLAGLAEVARRRGDADRARALLLDARDRYAARHDALGVADVEERLRPLLSAC
jgi:predicted ATPase